MELGIYTFGDLIPGPRSESVVSARDRMDQMLALGAILRRSRFGYRRCWRAPLCTVRKFGDCSDTSGDGCDHQASATHQRDDAPEHRGSGTARSRSSLQLTSFRTAARN